MGGISISFDGMPENFLLPKHMVEFSTVRANKGLSAVPHQILVIGHRDAAAPVAEGVKTAVVNGDDAGEKFGASSMVRTIVDAVRRQDAFTRILVTALDDDGAR